MAMPLAMTAVMVVIMVIVVVVVMATVRAPLRWVAAIVIAHEVHRLVAGAVARAIALPILGMTRRHAHVDRALAHAIDGLRDDHRLWVDQHRLGVADVDATIKAWLVVPMLTPTSCAWAGWKDTDAARAATAIRGRMDGVFMIIQRCGVGGG